MAEEFFGPAAAFRLQKPYFLYMGNHRAYKNIPRMLAAFKLSKLSEDFLFLLSGNPDARLCEVVKGLGLEGSVVFGGVFAEELLPSIYRGAVAPVFVSLNEGFGIPNIEAFAAGTPVITSNRSAIPEIVEDAATLVDPTNVEDISNALNSVVVGGASLDRMKMKAKSIAKNYSWENTARSFWSEESFRCVP